MGVFRVREGDELLKLFAGGAGIDGLDGGATVRFEKTAEGLRTKQRQEEEAENFIQKKRSTGGGATVGFE